VASKDDVQRVIKIANQFPPTRAGEQALNINFDSLPPYPAKALDEYKEDGGDDTPLRALVRDAIKTLTETNSALKDSFDAPQGNPQAETQFKDNIKRMSMDVAKLTFKVTTAREELTGDDIVAMREKEPKYWQAAYDYTVARLSARIAYIYEYNVKLGEIRKEFPERDPNLHSGWRLAARKKMDSVAEKDAQMAAKILEGMAKDFKGSPWELIARRERLTSLGLEWKPRAR
jgi:hypothetical protein